MAHGSSQPAVVRQLDELGRNANLGKHRHFCAAFRAKQRNDRLGVMVVAINVVLGSVFFVTLSKEIPESAKWLGGFLGLAGALISGVTTFFNFGKQFEGHRTMGNKYLALSRQCSLAVAQFSDGLIDLKGVDAVLRQLNERYQEVNDEAKGFPTSERDFQKALASERQRVEAFEQRWGTPDAARDGRRVA